MNKKELEAFARRPAKDINTHAWQVRLWVMTISGR